MLCISRFKYSQTATYCPGFTPIVDCVVNPDDPLTLRQSGEYHRVPEIIGLNEDDANLFVALGNVCVSLLKIITSGHVCFRVIH